MFVHAASNGALDIDTTTLPGGDILNHCWPQTAQEFAIISRRPVDACNCSQALIMVLLTMTPAIVDGLQTVDVSAGAAAVAEETSQTQTSEPSLRDPAVGNPISHGQILDLWKTLSTGHGHQASPSLEQLLRGSRVYSPPPPPKPEPVRAFSSNGTDGALAGRCG